MAAGLFLQACVMLACLITVLLTILLSREYDLYCFAPSNRWFVITFWIHAACALQGTCQVHCEDLQWLPLKNPGRVPYTLAIILVWIILDSDKPTLKIFSNCLLQNPGHVPYALALPSVWFCWFQTRQVLESSATASPKSRARAIRISPAICIFLLWILLDQLLESSAVPWSVH